MLRYTHGTRRERRDVVTKDTSQKKETFHQEMNCQEQQISGEEDALNNHQWRRRSNLGEKQEDVEKAAGNQRRCRRLGPETPTARTCQLLSLPYLSPTLPLTLVVYRTSSGSI